MPHDVINVKQTKITGIKLVYLVTFSEVHHTVSNTSKSQNASIDLDIRNKVIVGLNI